MEKQNNKPLIIAGALFALVILIILGVTFIPSKLYKPKYGFLYTWESYEPRLDPAQPVPLNKTLSVENGKVVEVDSPQGSSSKIYYYDITTEKSSELSLPEAQKFTLDQNRTSPDGFDVQYGTQVGGDFIFFYSGNDYDSIYMTGHNTKKKVNIIKPSDKNFYYNSFKFLGWVTQ